MFEQHFGLRESPFHSSHQLRFLYPSREHQEARAHLRYGIENREPFVLITGEVGTGKTTALYDALDEWGSQVVIALVTNSALTRQELLEEIGLRFGLPVAPGTSKPQVLAQLERFLGGVRARGEHAVLVLDEAQNLPPDLLEEIRLLSNLETGGERLLQIFLVGQPELEAKLAQPSLRQLRQRITVHYRLNPLSPEETAGYIHHRLSVAGGNAWALFPPETCREVYRVTHGIPREINTIASRALLSAFTEAASSVLPDHVSATAGETEFHSVMGEAIDEMPDVSVFASGVAPREESAPPPPVAPAAREPAAARAAAPAPPAPPASRPAPIAPPAPAPAPAASAPTPPVPHSPSASRIAARAPVAPAPPGARPPAPAWSPPALPDGHSHIEQVERQDMDAWNVAARGLLEARKRTPEGPAPNAPLRAAPGALGADAVQPRFPSPAELAARSPFARPDGADLGGLPPRLREKIAADIERDETAHRPWVPWLVGIALFAALAMALIMLQRLQVIDVPILRSVAGVMEQAPPIPRPVLAASAGSGASPGATRDSVSAMPVPESARAIAPATGAAAAPHRGATATPAPAPAPKNAAKSTATPKTSTPARPVGSNGGAAVSKVPAPKPAPAKSVPRPAVEESSALANDDTAGGEGAFLGPHFGIAVGAFLDRTRANRERVRMAGITALPVRVVPFRDSGATMYRVVVGDWPSEDEANQRANDLLAANRIQEARVLEIAGGAH